METAHRRKAAMAMSTLPRYAGGGLIEGFKRAVGMAPPETMIEKFARQDAERAAKQPKPAPQPEPVKAISSYAGNNALDRRMAEADMKAQGGPIQGPGTATSDEIPIMASNGEYMIRAAAVEEIGTEVLDAINKLGDDNEVEDDPEDKQPGKYAVGGEIKPMDATAVADRQMFSNAFDKLKDTSETAGRAIADVATIVPRGVVGAYDSTVVRPMRAMGVNASYLSPALTPDGASVDSATPFSDIKRARDAQQTMGSLPASPNATTMMQRQVGNAGTGDGREPYQPKYPIGQNTSIPTPAMPAAPATPGNSFGDATSFYSNRQPINPQDQLAMDGIQARQDNRDANAAQRMQFNSEVSAANAVNDWQANRGKSVARLAMEGKLAQDVRGDATARYQSDNSLKGAGLSADASRYGTDMQRENNQGNLGVAKGRLANETATTELDNASKVQMQAAQRALADAKTPQEQESAINTLRALQGKYGKEAPAEQYAYAPGGQTVDPTTGQLVTSPGVIFNKATGQTAQQGQAGSIQTDPRAAAIRDNKNLTREQKLAELQKIGYK